MMAAPPFVGMEIRPKWTGVPKYSAVQICLIAFGLGTLARHPKLFPFAAILLVAFAAMFVVTWGLYQQFARISLDGADATLPSHWLGSRRVPVVAVRRVAQRSVKTGWSRRPSQRFIFADASNHSMAAINAAHWNRSAVLALASQAGWAVDGNWATVEDGRVVESDLPGSTSYWDRNPDVTQLARAAGWIAVGVAGYLVFGPV